MIGGTGLFFRLPPCLRHQTFLQLSSIGRCQSWPKTIQRTSIPRNFSIGLTLRSAEPRIIKPKRLGSKPAPTPPAPRPYPIRRDQPSPVDASGRLAQGMLSQGPVLLYASPSHGGFFLISYLCGGGLLLGCMLMALDVLKEREDRPTLTAGVKLLSAVQVVVVTCMGTALLLAPTKLVRSITLIPAASKAATTAAAAHAGPVFRFEVKRGLPFLPPYALETPLSGVSISRNVVGEDISPLSVPYDRAREFTAFHADRKAKTKGEKESLAKVLGVPEPRKLGFFQAFKREVRRMFLRDQMAYISLVGNGLVKMDLQRGYLLDEGRPLMRMATLDTSTRNIFARMQGIASR